MYYISVPEIAYKMLGGCKILQCFCFWIPKISSLFLLHSTSSPSWAYFFFIVPLLLFPRNKMVRNNIRKPRTCMRGARIGHQDRGAQLFFLTLHWGPGDSGRGLRAARTICSSEQCTSEKTPGKGFWNIETTVCWFLDWAGKKNICTWLKILSY